MKRINLKSKIIMAFLLVSLGPFILMGAFTTIKNTETIKKMASDDLQSIKELKTKSIVFYFNLIKNQLITMAESDTVISTLNSFSKSFYEQDYGNNIDLKEVNKSLEFYYAEEFGAKYKKQNEDDSHSLSRLSMMDKNAKFRQFQYISSNPFPLGQKSKLIQAKINTAYSKDHSKVHDELKLFQSTFGYYDVFLVSVKGDVVYSVFKELDFATNLEVGPYADSGLGRVFQKVKNLKSSSEYVFEDYSLYYPSYNDPASFIAAPVFDKGIFIGALIFQMPLDRINAVIKATASEGESGATYLVGKDFKMRSDHRIDKRFSVGNSFKEVGKKGQMINSATKEAFLGNTGSIVSEDDRGEFLASYSPINILGKDWAIVSEVLTSETYRELNKQQKYILIFGGIFTLLILFVSNFLGKGIASPILDVSKNLSRDSNEVLNLSQNIFENSKKVADLINEEAGAIQETVSSIEEVTSMIKNTNSAAESGLDGIDHAKSKADFGNKVMHDLDVAMEHIGEGNFQLEEIAKIIKEISDRTNVINDIVFKTQLLSFNASIEAARAGQHGKGFAVVAEEVGNLATMSGTASQEIKDLLDESQDQVSKIIEKTKISIQKGQEVTKDALSIFNEINSGIDNVSTQIKNIFVATAEQKEGVDQVTIAMKKLDEISNKNSGISMATAKEGRFLKKLSVDFSKLSDILTVLVLGEGNKINDDKFKNHRSLSENDGIEDIDGLIDDLVSKSDKIREQNSNSINDKNNS